MVVLSLAYEVEGWSCLFDAQEPFISISRDKTTTTASLRVHDCIDPKETSMRGSSGHRNYDVFGTIEK